MSKAGKLAAQVLRRCGKARLGEADLRRAAERYGYTVVPFGAFDEESPTAELMRQLQLRGYAAAHRGFTYADAHFRLIFVQGELAERERMIVLAHELGHIACGHLERAGIVGSDVTEEFEANEFAQKLLHPPASAAAAAWLRANGRAVGAAVLALALCAALLSAYRTRVTPPMETYYVTSAGTHYHRKDCIVIQGKTNVRELTVKERASGGYAPCGVCLPDAK